MTWHWLFGLFSPSKRRNACQELVAAPRPATASKANVTSLRCALIQSPLHEQRGWVAGLARHHWLSWTAEKAVRWPSGHSSSSVVLSGEAAALERAAQLTLPILAMQDPDDPVTRAQFSRELARRNPRVQLWIAPSIEPDHPDLAWKGGWGSHVSAFEFYPEETIGRIMQFINTY